MKQNYDENTYTSQNGEPYKSSQYSLGEVEVRLHMLPERATYFMEDERCDQIKSFNKQEDF